MKLKTTEWFVSKAKDVHGIQYDYSKTEYKGALLKLQIVCPIHGVFSQRPSDHISGNGCRHCALERKKLNYEDFILKATKIHKGKYNYLSIEYSNNKAYIRYICKRHGEQRQYTYHHIDRKAGCNDCAKEDKKFIRLSSLEDFITNSRKAHNNLYDYSLIVEYRGGRYKYPIICKKHGTFYQTGASHLRGYGCESCAKEYTKELFGYTQETYIESCTKTHDGKYDYSKVEFINTKEDVLIVCPLHGSFIQNSRSHLRGQGCQTCGNIASVVPKNLKRVEEDKEKLLLLEGGIYVLKIKGFGDNIYKIGLSKDPSARIKAITANINKEGHEAEIEQAYYKSFNRYKSFIIERNLHLIYGSLNVQSRVKFDGHTELFTLKDEDIKNIITLLESEPHTD